MQLEAIYTDSRKKEDGSWKPERIEETNLSLHKSETDSRYCVIYLKERPVTSLDPEYNITNVNDINELFSVELVNRYTKNANKLSYVSSLNNLTPGSFYVDSESGKIIILSSAYSEEAYTCNAIYYGLGSIIRSSLFNGLINRLIDAEKYNVNRANLSSAINYELGTILFFKESNEAFMLFNIESSLNNKVAKWLPLIFDKFGTDKNYMKATDCCGVEFYVNDGSLSQPQCVARFTNYGEFVLDTNSVNIRESEDATRKFLFISKNTKPRNVVLAKEICWDDIYGKPSSFDLTALYPITLTQDHVIKHERAYSHIPDNTTGSKKAVLIGLDKTVFGWKMLTYNDINLGAESPLYIGTSSNDTNIIGHVISVIHVPTPGEGDSNKFLMCLDATATDLAEKLGWVDITGVGGGGSNVTLSNGTYISIMKIGDDYTISHASDENGYIGHIPKPNSSSVVNKFLKCTSYNDSTYTLGWVSIEQQSINIDLISTNSSIIITKGSDSTYNLVLNRNIYADLIRLDGSGKILPPHFDVSSSVFNYTSSFFGIKDSSNFYYYNNQTKLSDVTTGWRSGLFVGSVYGGLRAATAVIASSYCTGKSSNNATDNYIYGIYFSKPIIKGGYGSSDNTFVFGTYGLYFEGLGNNNSSTTNLSSFNTYGIYFDYVIGKRFAYGISINKIYSFDYTNSSAYGLHVENLAGRSSAYSIRLRNIAARCLDDNNNFLDATSRAAAFLFANDITCGVINYVDRRSTSNLAAGIWVVGVRSLGKRDSTSTQSFIVRTYGINLVDITSRYDGDQTSNVTVEAYGFRVSSIVCSSVAGVTNSNVYGYHASTLTGTNSTVYGVCLFALRGNRNVYGIYTRDLTSTSGSVYGMYTSNLTCDSSSVYGVYTSSLTSTSGSVYGVYVSGLSSTNNSIFAYSLRNSTSTYGIYGLYLLDCTAPSFTGLYISNVKSPGFNGACIIASTTDDTNPNTIYGLYTSISNTNMKLNVFSSYFSGAPSIFSGATYLGLTSSGVCQYSDIISQNYPFLDRNSSILALYSNSDSTSSTSGIILGIRYNSNLKRLWEIRLASQMSYGATNILSSMSPSDLCLYYYNENDTTYVQNMPTYVFGSSYFYMGAPIVSNRGIYVTDRYMTDSSNLLVDSAGVVRDIVADSSYSRTYDSSLNGSDFTFSILSDSTLQNYKKLIFNDVTCVGHDTTRFSRIVFNGTSSYSPRWFKLNTEYTLNSSFDLAVGPGEVFQISMLIKQSDNTSACISPSDVVFTIQPIDQTSNVEISRLPDTVSVVDSSNIGTKWKYNRFYFSLPSDTPYGVIKNIALRCWIPSNVTKANIDIAWFDVRKLSTSKVLTYAYSTNVRHTFYSAETISFCARKLNLNGVNFVSAPNFTTLQQMAGPNTIGVVTPYNDRSAAGIYFCTIDLTSGETVWKKVRLESV